MTPSIRFLALAALLLATGCNVVVPVELDSDLPLSGSPGRFAVAVPIDLAQNETLWSYRESIAELRVDELEVAVVSTGAANEAGEVRILIALRPDGAPEDGSFDLPVLALEGLRVAVGERAVLSAVPGIADTLLAELEGDGRFSAVAIVESEGAVDVRLGLFVRGEATVMGALR